MLNLHGRTLTMATEQEKIPYRTWAKYSLRAIQLHQNDKYVRIVDGDEGKWDDDERPLSEITEQNGWYEI